MRKKGCVASEGEGSFFVTCGQALGGSSGLAGMLLTRWELSDITGLLRIPFTLDAVTIYCAEIKGQLNESQSALLLVL